jgi:hypothetical protein
MASPFYDPFNGNGKIVKQYPDKVIWMHETEEGVIYCTQKLVDPIIEANKERFNESNGKRWGDGQLVADIPENIYFDKLLPAKLQGDDAYIKRFLNDKDNEAFRTFKGTL